MLIGIDCRLWNQTGVGRYIRNLVLNLTLIDKKNDYVLFASSEDYDNLKSQISPARNVSASVAGGSSKWRLIKTDIRWHTVSEQIKFASVLNSYNFDLVHFPYFSVPVFYRKNYVVTVHDLITNKFATGKASTLPYPVYLSKRIAYKLVLRNALKKSKKIIVPSGSVKNDLLSTYKKLDPNKIVVTYEGGFENIIKNNRKSLIKEKYFLRVGNFYPHKNVQTLLTAFKIFIEKSLDKNTKLVLVGKKDIFYKRIEDEIKNLDISQNVIILEQLRDEDLVCLYKNSIATIIPSFMEGFSLTAVEAMSLGSLVIASDIPVHREICKNGALFFNPNDSYELYEKLNEVLRLTTSEKKIIQQNEMDWIKKFSWKKMAEQTLQIYESSASASSA